MFEKETEAIRQANNALFEANQRSLEHSRYKARQYVATAGAEECLWLINELINRVSTITGVAPELEDAADSLERFIKADGDIFK